MGAMHRVHTVQAPRRDQRAAAVSCPRARNSQLLPHRILHLPVGRLFVAQTRVKATCHPEHSLDLVLTHDAQPAQPPYFGRISGTCGRSATRTASRSRVSGRFSTGAAVSATRSTRPENRAARWWRRVNWEGWLRGTSTLRPAAASVVRSPGAGILIDGPAVAGASCRDTLLGGLAGGPSWICPSPAPRRRPCRGR